MIWYSHLFKNFPQFVVIQTVKGFRLVNEAELDIFLELPCFLNDPMNVDNSISSFSLFPLILQDQKIVQSSFSFYFALNRTVSNNFNITRQYLVSSDHL